MIPYAFGLVIVACLPLPGLAHAASSDTALATSHRLMRERRYDEAVVYLQAALDSTKRPNPVAKFLAFCFARTGQYDDAIALLERLCEAGKMGRSLVTHLWIPTAEFPTPTTELAILSRRTTPASAFGLCLPPTRLFERLAQTNLAQLWLVEGQAALDAGNTASATQHLWRAPEECPHADRPVWLRAKQAHSKLHWAAHEQVSQVFRKHLRGRDFATAAQAFHDVAWAYPYTTPGARAFYFEAKCLRDLGKPAQAETLFKSFLKKHSHSHLASTVCYQLGQQAAGKGKPKDALKWYERALDNHPNGANADMCAFLIAVHHWERKHYKRCAELSEYLLAHHPKSPLCPRAKLMLEYVKRRAAARRKVGQAS